MTNQIAQKPIAMFKTLSTMRVNVLGGIYRVQ